MAGEVHIEDGAPGGYGTVFEEFTEVGNEVLHCLWGLGERDESRAGLEWWGGYLFIDHCSEFVAAIVDVGETAIAFF